jgi:large subunit ribosomal protein L21
LKQKENETMFALIRVAGKQYRVQNGTELLVNRLALDEGAAFDGAEVLMIGDGDDVQVGTPVVEGARVAATVVRHSKGRKIRVFKYKAKKNYRRRKGARDYQTLLRINSISGTGTRSQGQGTENQQTTAAAPATVTPTTVAPPTTAPVTPVAPVTQAPVAQTPMAQATPVVQTAPAQAPASQTAPVAQASPTVQSSATQAPAQAAPAAQAPNVASSSSQTEGVSTTNGT